MPKTYVELGIEQFGGLADFYSKNVAAVFASRRPDPELQKQLQDANTSAANAMTNLKNYLVGERKNANDKFALGADLFAQMVKQTEQVDLPVAQIEAAGKAASRCQHGGAENRMRHLRAEGVVGPMRRENAAGEQAQGRPRRGGAQPAQKC